jgi:hypothetical protein
MEAVAHRYPYSPNLFHYAVALALNGQPDQAKLELMRLRALHGEVLYREALRGIASISEHYPELAAMAMH